MTTRRLLLIVLVVILLLVIMHPAMASTAFPTACGQPANIQADFQGIPCSEIDRAVHEAAHEFGIDEGRFRRSANCESHFRPAAQRPGSQFIGVMQLGNSFVPDRVVPFDNNQSVDLGQGMPGYSGPGTAFNTRNPFHNTRLAAWTIAQEGYSEWQCKGY